jgi:hypothetical protein
MTISKLYNNPIWSVSLQTSAMDEQERREALLMARVAGMDPTMSFKSYGDADVHAEKLRKATGLPFLVAASPK